MLWGLRCATARTSPNTQMDYTMFGKHNATLQRQIHRQRGLVRHLTSAHAPAQLFYKYSIVGVRNVHICTDVSHRQAVNGLKSVCTNVRRMHTGSGMPYRCIHTQLYHSYILHAHKHTQLNARHMPNHMQKNAKLRRVHAPQTNIRFASSKPHTVVAGNRVRNTKDIQSEKNTLSTAEISSRNVGIKNDNAADVRVGENDDSTTITFGKIKEVEQFKEAMSTIYGLKLQDQIREYLYRAIDTLSNGLRTSTANRVILLRELEEGVREHCKYMPTLGHYNAMIKFTCVNDDVDGAIHFVNCLKQAGHTPDVTTYSTIITVYAKTADLDTAVDMFLKMEKHNLKPGDQAYNAMFHAYRVNNDMEGAMYLLSVMKKRGLQPSPLSKRSLIPMLAYYGTSKTNSAVSTSALNMYDELLKEGHPPDNRCFHAVLRNLLYHGKTETAQAMFEEGFKYTETPTPAIYARTEAGRDTDMDTHTDSSTGTTGSESHGDVCAEEKASSTDKGTGSDSSSHGSEAGVGDHMPGRISTELVDETGEMTSPEKELEGSTRMHTLGGVNNTHTQTENNTTHTHTDKEVSEPDRDDGVTAHTIEKNTTEQGVQRKAAAPTGGRVVYSSTTYTMMLDHYINTKNYTKAIEVGSIVPEARLEGQVLRRMLIAYRCKNDVESMNQIVKRMAELRVPHEVFFKAQQLTKTMTMLNTLIDRNTDATRGTTFAPWAELPQPLRDDSTATSANERKRIPKRKAEERYAANL